MGITRTIDKMRQRFFWKSMYSDIVNYCKRCQLCQQRKNPVKPVVGPTIPLPITQNPWERVHVDISGEYTTCENSSNKYILGFVDSFTKYVELVPISDMKATTVADAFISNVICRHGVPSSLHSDRGQNFLFNIIREVCNILEIKKTNTSGFRPQCNSQIEVVWKKCFGCFGEILS